MRNFISWSSAARRITATVPMRNYIVGTIEETIVLSNRYIERRTSVTSAWRKRSYAQFSVASHLEVHNSTRHLNIDLPTIATVASSVVFLICLFALSIWAMSGFAMIHPFIASITMIGCVGFYAMGMRSKTSRTTK